MNAARTWTGDELRQTFEDTAKADELDPDEEHGKTPTSWMAVNRMLTVSGKKLSRKF